MDLSSASASAMSLIFRPMRPVLAVGVARSVGLSATIALQKLLYRSRCQLGCGIGMGPGNHILDGGPDLYNIGLAAMSCAKTAEPIKRLLGMWTFRHITLTSCSHYRCVVGGGIYTGNWPVLLVSAS